MMNARMRHNVNILFTDGRITGIKSYAGGRSYEETRAWCHARINELAALGYTVKIFNICSMKVVF